MSDDALALLAAEAGIAVDWRDAAGQARTIAPDTLRAVLSALGHACTTAEDIVASRAALRAGATALAPLVTAVAGKPTLLPVRSGMRAKLLAESGGERDLKLIPAAGGVCLPPIEEPGYHRLLIGQREIVLAVAPARAPAVPGRLWGIAAQVYGLRRAGDGGIGDLAGVAALAEAAARRGADALALSPLHAPFISQPERYGPYSPSSRLFLNPLHAAAEEVLGIEMVTRAAMRAGVAAAFARSEALALIDWPSAAAAKLRLFRALFAGLAGTEFPDSLRADFARFEAEGGALLAGHACFEALAAEQLAAGPDGADWRRWPTDLRRPDSPAVAAFTASHRRDILFHLFLQWLAERSLARAQARACAAGMRVGLITDIAVGMDPLGSHAWSRQGEVLSRVSIGAPPDLFNPNGQSWGITGFAPHALTAGGFAPFIATLRAALRHAGGVRIDHAMGLRRLWLVPDGASPADGAYLTYPLTDLLRLLVLEAARHRALVVGEDLGTVPEGFRETLDAAGILGMRVLWFEQQQGQFLAPEAWDRSTMAMTSTHDLPTAAGWWTGADIALRAAHGVLGRARRLEEVEAERATERGTIWRAFQTAGVAAGAPPPDGTDGAEAFVDAAVQFVARTPCALALLPLEDVLGVEEQPNLPGTVDEHPNWRRRNQQPAATVLDGPAAARRLTAVAKERPR